MYIAAMRFSWDCRKQLKHLQFFAFVGLVLFARVLLAQQMPPGHDMAGMLPIQPPDKLPVPIHMSGIGNAHISVTATPEAQAWFDQGLNLMHDFWDYESIKAFEQGVRVDPKCAMCYWGLAQAEQSRGKDTES